MRSDLFRLRMLMLTMFIQCHYGISHHHIAWILVAFPCSPFSSSCPLPSACCTSKPLDKDKHMEAGQHVNRTYEIFPIHFGKCILIYQFSQFSSSFQLFPTTKIYLIYSILIGKRHTSYTTVMSRSRLLSNVSPIFMENDETNEQFIFCFFIFTE